MNFQNYNQMSPMMSLQLYVIKLFLKIKIFIWLELEYDEHAIPVDAVEMDVRGIINILFYIKMK